MKKQIKLHVSAIVLLVVLFVLNSKQDKGISQSLNSIGIVMLMLATISNFAVTTWRKLTNN